MTTVDQLNQLPAPDIRQVMFRGDTVKFKLLLDEPAAGTAWIRTNIGRAVIQRREIIRSVHHDETPLGRDWFDLPMARIDSRSFGVTLALSEIGHFEAKCYFLPLDQSTPIWPPGPNSAVNVDSADACCANIIYNAFVRQFGPNKFIRQVPAAAEDEVLQRLDHEGYTVIPPSGTFRDLVDELDFIIGTLGCRLLMLLPIHPTPTTYGRMGRFGSPYAALSFTAVDPALAVFDPSATPLEQFIEVVDAVHRRNARLIIDIAINHTGWAASLHETHPEWLVRKADGRIEVPGAWGVRWEDLTKLDYRRKKLWQFMADIFLKWCRRGVDGFRCDAGYMIPLAAWKYIVARVRDQYPDTVFLLEGLGGRISVTRELLNSANLNWAYSELFQNYDRAQIEHYLPEANDTSARDGISVHFAETHDNPRLAAKSTEYARMRTALCALTSHQGGFGFTNGVEWLATEKINVHGAPSLNWGAEPNMVGQIGQLTRLLKAHPAFFDRTNVHLIQKGEDSHLVVLRHHLDSGKRLLIIVNLDEKQPASAQWDTAGAGMADTEFIDLMSRESVTAAADGHRRVVALAPLQVMCLTADKTDLDLMEAYPRQSFAIPPRVITQRLRAKAMEVLGYYRGTCDISDLNPGSLADTLHENPAALCRQMHLDGDEPRVIRWQWPRDIKREVMVPPGHFLIVSADHPFSASLIEGRRTRGFEKSLPCADGSQFVLFTPPRIRPGLRAMQLRLTIYADRNGRQITAPLLFLPEPLTARHQGVFKKTELKRHPLIFMATNASGATMRIPVAWGELTSRYDALLAANLSPDHPQDRWIMLTRCRIWLAYQGYSQDLNQDCLHRFNADPSGAGCWHFFVPCGQGQHVAISIRASLAFSENRIDLTFKRHRAEKTPEHLPDSQKVQVIVRPDIENRSFHATTKAYTGPENSFLPAVSPGPQGFTFKPDTTRVLQMKISAGQYQAEPQWQYMVHRKQEAERGLDPDSDLFSPGYFQMPLGGGDMISIAAATSTGDTQSAMDGLTANPADPCHTGEPPECEPLTTLTNSLDAYVVNRGRLKTVIAGYPWFLDWGRDALIFSRGLIAAGHLDTARDVLVQFGQFEEKGTLPNMIAGQQAANRDTSDAPLWFFTACNDLVKAQGNDLFFSEDSGGRTVAQILNSIGTAIVAGTPNGVRMDPESALVYSPGHFTWMDTDHPAGTPRQGYPVEIQALWIAALDVLSTIDSDPGAQDWPGLKIRAQNSLRNYFWQEAEGYLSDCLHAAEPMPASSAAPDDALRPNQLLAITLGALTDKILARRVLAACEELLVPGAIRSLADRPVRRHLPIHHRGKLLNDPQHPYHGIYAGDEDTRRKPAYHNGTAWTWQFPLYCEAWHHSYGLPGRKTALAWLTSSIRLIVTGCAGHIPEIVDGNIPHRQRGCDAQAWGVSEWVRVWTKLVGAVEPV